MAKINVALLSMIVWFPLLISCGESPKGSNHASESSAQAIMKNLSVDEFKGAMDTLKKGIVLDVRTPGEYKSGHVPGAVNIDWNGSAFNDEVSKLDKSQTVLIYCLSGGRSSAAMQRMKSLGFTEVYNMRGGISAWKSKGYPTEG